VGGFREQREKLERQEESEGGYIRNRDKNGIVQTKNIYDNKEQIHLEVADKNHKT
jgi:hypothetical protein